MLRFQTRLLRRAVQIAGDTPALAASLGVAEDAIRLRVGMVRLRHGVMINLPVDSRDAM